MSRNSVLKGVPKQQECCHVISYSGARRNSLMSHICDSEGYHSRALRRFLRYLMLAAGLRTQLRIWEAGGCCAISNSIFGYIDGRKKRVCPGAHFAPATGCRRRPPSNGYDTFRRRVRAELHLSQPCSIFGKNTSGLWGYHNSLL